MEFDPCRLIQGLSVRIQSGRRTQPASHIARLACPAQFKDESLIDHLPFESCAGLIVVPMDTVILSATGTAANIVARFPALRAARRQSK
jgi:hypothetical protein